MSSLINHILYCLPLGGWLTNTPFGMIYGTFIFSAFSCVLLGLSKVIFKTYFSNQKRKILFLIFVAGPSFLISACFIYVTMRTTYLCYTIPLFESISFGYLIPVYQGLTLIAYLFFIGYLIDFIIRLVRHLRKRKTDGSAATPTS